MADADFLVLKRRVFTDKSTIGDLWAEGKFFSHVLENPCRQNAKRTSAIPAGRYRVAIMHSPKYKRPMPRLMDVPGRDGILIHWGNRPEDTEGCLLPGIYNEDQPDFVGRSKATFDILFDRLTGLAPGEIWISITGGREAG
jgi:hypothetical protein